MQNRQGRIVETLRAADNFVGDYAATMPDVATSGTRRKLSSQLADLNRFAATQFGSSRDSEGFTQKKSTLRTVLVTQHMAPIARVAAADLPKGPDLADLSMPSSKVSTQVLHGAAMGMASHADRHSATFVAAGLPVDFVSRLRDTANAMVAAIDDRARSRGARQSATEQIAVQVISARKTLRALDCLVQIALQNDPELLGKWKVEIKPTAKLGRTRVAAGTPGTPATPATQPPVAAG